MAALPEDRKKQCRTPKEAQTASRNRSNFRCRVTMSPANPAMSDMRIGVPEGAMCRMFVRRTGCVVTVCSSPERDR